MKKTVFCVLLVILFSCPALTSSAAGIPPTITQHPENTWVVQGEMAEFSVMANNGEPLTYQWQRLDDDSNTWSNINGANAADYSFITSLSDNGSQFRVEVSNDYDGVTSNAAILTVNAVAGIPPTITQHPKDVEIVIDEMAKFSVTATGTEPLIYQWQSSNDISNTWSNISGADTANLFINASFFNNKIRVVVSNNYGSVTSNIANLELKPRIHHRPPEYPPPEYDGGCNSIMGGGIFGILIMISAFWGRGRR